MSSNWIDAEKNLKNFRKMMKIIRRFTPKRKKTKPFKYDWEQERKEILV